MEFEAGDQTKNTRKENKKKRRKETNYAVVVKVEKKIKHRQTSLEHRQFLTQQIVERKQWLHQTTLESTHVTINKQSPGTLKSHHVFKSKFWRKGTYVLSLQKVRQRVTAVSFSHTLTAHFTKSEEDDDDACDFFLSCVCLPRSLFSLAKNTRD